MRDIPATFCDEFLAWFRDATEKAWADRPTRTFAEFEAARVGGTDWQQGTRWLNGLNDDEIAVVEARDPVLG